jgi:hypothetical protein
MIQQRHPGPRRREEQIEPGIQSLIKSAMDKVCGPDEFDSKITGAKDYSPARALLEPIFEVKLIFAGDRRLDSIKDAASMVGISQQGGDPVSDLNVAAAQLDSDIDGLHDKVTQAITDAETLKSTIRPGKNTFGSEFRP